ncbi:polysaccharide deacetylase family protein [Halothiobacillus sp. DCM-1]|uniref:polysaccharide deacetylase family protein n=1 Tax=Halothiobacillus sp. DCM-1 TaxID=3112558 RepID=UPI0032569B90
MPGFAGLLGAAASVLGLLLLARYNLWRWPRARALPRILMYHRVLPAVTGQGITMNRSRFAWQMDQLARRGARFVTVSELLAAQDPRQMVAITFDDGYADNYQYAWPILRAHGAPATIYLAPEMSGIERLTPAMIREMAASGVEFGAHTMTHIHLPSTDDAQALAEIQASKAAVESLTGQPCRSFAYPYGKFTDRHVQMVRAAGFSSAVTTKKQIKSAEALRAAPLELPRLSMVGQMNRFEFWLTITRGRYRV